MTQQTSDAPDFAVDATLREKLRITMDYHLGKGRGRDMVIDNVLDRLEQELREPGLRNAAKIASGGADLHRLLNLDDLVTKWTAGELQPETLSTLLHVLQQRMARARNVLTGFTSYDDDPSRRPASGESGPGAQTAVEMVCDRAEGPTADACRQAARRAADQLSWITRPARSPFKFTTSVDTSDEAAPDFVSAVATEVMRLPFTSGGTSDEHGDRFGAVQDAVERILLRPEFSLPPPPATRPRDRAEVVAECRERALRFWQEIDALCGTAP